MASGLRFAGHATDCEIWHEGIGLHVAPLRWCGESGKSIPTGQARHRSIFIATIVVWAAGSAAWAQSTPSHGYLVVADGLKIHYVVVSRGTPVILIHRAGGSAEGNRLANGIAEALAKHHRVVAIDCRGHSKSDNRPSGGLQNRTMAQDVIELMNHLDIAKAYAHGYSMGGAIAEQMHARYPERLISVALGGWGIQEIDPDWKAKVPPDKEGSDPEEAGLYAKFGAKLAERNQASGTGQDARTHWPKRPDRRGV